MLIFHPFTFPCSLGLSTLCKVIFLKKSFMQPMRSLDKYVRRPSFFFSFGFGEGQEEEERDLLLIVFLFPMCSHQVFMGFS